MKKTSVKILAMGLVASLVAPAALAMQDIKVGSGGPKGNYFSMAKDIASYCNEELSNSDISVHNTGGSVDNLLGMQNKRFNIGIVQEDVLQYHAKRSPSKVNKNRVKVISGLHSEAVHLLIPKGYQPKSGDKKGYFDKFFSKKSSSTPKIELNMLKGQTIGSWGGSIVSAEALGYFFNLNLNVVQVPKDKQVPASNKVPLLLVGGHPYKVVEEYLASGQWLLVSLDYDKISQTASFYSRETVNYKINGKVVGTPTIGVRALLLGKSLRKKSRNLAMTEIATCINMNAADLADDPETNPLWNSVFDYIEDEEQVDWSYFPLDESKLNEEY